MTISNGKHHFHISHDIHIPPFCFTFDTQFFSTSRQRFYVMTTSILIIALPSALICFFASVRLGLGLAHHLE